ncbi:MAG: cyclic nucleotide-binding domain-containing protein [Chloroflexales bacterium]|nr:cyclic nucleotide-binding domain-containing protein [Chloroflexales bacterium]
MVSPELLRRYPFFAGLSMDQITSLAMAAEEVEVAPDTYLFREGDELNQFYIVVEGRVALSIGLLERGDRTSVAEVAVRSREMVVSMVGASQIMAWSALVPPYVATSSGKTLTACRLIAVDCSELRANFEEDAQFGYLMMRKVAQVIRDRLQDMHHESLAYSAENIG